MGDCKEVGVEKKIVENKKFSLFDYVTLKRRRRLVIDDSCSSDDDVDTTGGIDPRNGDGDGDGERSGKKKMKSNEASVDRHVSGGMDTSNSNTFREIIDLTSDASVSADGDVQSLVGGGGGENSQLSSKAQLDAIFKHIMSGSSNTEQVELMREHNRLLRVRELQAHNPYVYSFSQCCQCQVLSDHGQFFKVRPRELKCLEPFRTAVATFASSLYLELNELDEDGEQKETDMIPFHRLLKVFIREVFTLSNELAYVIGESSGLDYIINGGEDGI